MTEPVERAGADSDTSAQSYLLFDVANLSLATPAARVDHVHDALDIEPVDGTPPWFSGLAVADGKLLPVTDLGALLGMPVAHGFTLQLHRDIGVAGVLVESVKGLFKQPTTRADPSERLPEVLSIGADDRGILVAGRFHHLLDFHALLQLPQLLCVADGT